MLRRRLRADAEDAGQEQDAGTFDRVILDMLAPWENVAGAARALIPGGLICCYVATTTQLSRGSMSYEASSPPERMS